MSIPSVMPSNHLILYHPLLLLPSVFPRIRVFSNESALCIRWPKYWSFSFSISASSVYSGLISLELTGLISLQSKGLSKMTTVHMIHFNPGVLCWSLVFDLLWMQSESSLHSVSLFHYPDLVINFTITFLLERHRLMSLFQLWDETALWNTIQYKQK